MANGNAQDKEHYATLGLFMEDNMGTVYGVTVKHAIIHSDTSIFIRHGKDASEDSNKFLGKTMNISDEASKDIGLIEIASNLKGRISNMIDCRRVSMHDSGIVNLHGRKVKKYLPSFSEYAMNNKGHCDIGRVVSEKEHAKYFGATGSKDHFLVKLTGGRFSAPGESGTIISLHPTTDSEQEILVGMILGEFNRDKNYTVCLYLSKGLEDMNKYLGKRLRICNSNACSFPRLVGSHHSEDILCGIRIFLTCNNNRVKTPEIIKPLSFDLVDRCRALLCKTFVEPDMYKVTMVMRIKCNLIAEVNERIYVSCRSYDNAEMVAVQSGLLACDSLFREDLKTAEKDLKLAFYSAGNCDLSTQMHIVYELTTYVTWFLLEQNKCDSLQKMQALLDYAIEDFNEARNKRGFPWHSLGYLYNDYSRLYMAKYDAVRSRNVRNLDEEQKLRLEAVKKAKQGYEIFKGLYLHKESKENHTCMVLSACQVVYCLLGCGSEFLVVEDEVTDSDIRKAETLLNSLEKSIPDLNEVPVVQKADFLIAKCDLYYRKGNVSKALKFALTCSEELQNKQYEDDNLRVRKRLQYLEAC